MKLSVDAWVSLFTGTPSIADAKWHNSEGLQEKYNGPDPIAFVHESGLSSKHFYLDYPQRCYLYSTKAKNLYIKRSKTHDHV